MLDRSNSSFPRKREPSSQALKIAGYPLDSRLRGNDWICYFSGSPAEICIQKHFRDTLEGGNP